MDYTFLANTTLFQGTTPKEVQSMLSCLNGKIQHYKKGEYIFYTGDTTQHLGIVLKGSVHIESVDFLGNASLLNRIAPGEIFAETYACSPTKTFLADVIANEDTEVLFLNVSHILQTCSSSCSHHNTLIHNLLFVMAQKNLSLSQRILHTSPKSIRSRLISYFSEQVALQGANKITIPLNRQQLADYLNVDRSALSGELSKMKKDGLIDYHKNQFHIY